MSYQEIGKRNTTLRKQQIEWQKNRKILLSNIKNLLDSDKRSHALIVEIFGYTGFFNVNLGEESSVRFTEGQRSIGKEIIELLYELGPNYFKNIIVGDAHATGIYSEPSNDDTGDAATSYLGDDPIDADDHDNTSNRANFGVTD